MKKIILIMVALCCVVLLAACDNGDTTMPPMNGYTADATYPNEIEQEGQHLLINSNHGSLPINGGTAQTTAAIPQPQQPSEAIRPLWPTGSGPHADTLQCGDFSIGIAYKSRVREGYFDYFHEFDYDIIHEILNMNHDAQDGHDFVIWVNQPVTDFSVVLTGVFQDHRREIRVPFANFEVASVLQVHEGLVISNYNHINYRGWSVVGFTNENGIRRYFRIVHFPARGNSDSILRLSEVSVGYDERFSGFAPWWERDLSAEQNNTQAWQTQWSHGFSMDAPCPYMRADLLEQTGISEYGWQVAADFLRGFDSLFASVGFPLTEWDADRRINVHVGHYHTWFGESGLPIVPETRPDIVFFHNSIDSHETGFFDSDGNRIVDVPWLTEWHYANYFRLFDFDNSGIPDILIHFNQTFEGCYSGFYQIFRYIDGEYVLMEETYVFADNYSQWRGFGSAHMLFTDESGRILTLIDSELHGMGYMVLEMTADQVTFTEVPMSDNWFNDWPEHHWMLWEVIPSGWEQLDSWLNHNPTIFGTDIGITPLHSFEDLEAELMAYLTYIR